MQTKVLENIKVYISSLHCCGGSNHKEESKCSKSTSRHPHAIESQTSAMMSKLRSNGPDKRESIASLSSASYTVSRIRSTAPRHHGAGAMSDREFGCVTYWNTDRGFGFVKPDDGVGDSRFIHVSHIKKAGSSELPRGQYQLRAWTGP
jgi:cold shock CspA family protein